MATKKDIDLVFILTLPRSGSTLLRFILDSHSKILAPAESQLAATCMNIFKVWAEATSLDEKYRITQAKKVARKTALDLIQKQLLTSNKSLFCDKSLPNIDFSEMLIDLFPEAKFICLYRHPLDFVHSALEACKFGYGSFGLTTYAASHIDNFLLGMIRAWSEKTAILAQFESSHSDRCIHVKYEDLVADTEATVNKLLSFLSVDFENEMLSTAFQVDHIDGPGDLKIRFMDEIDQTYIGKGVNLPIKMIPQYAVDQINVQLAHLGYLAIRPDNKLSHFEGKLPRLKDEDALVLTKFFERFSEELSTMTIDNLNYLDYLPINIVIYELEADGFYKIAKDSCKFVTDASPDGSTLSLSFTTWKSIVFGIVDISETAINGSVKVIEIKEPQGLLKSMLNHWELMGKHLVFQKT
jgi:hypothetical protein